ncbi:hypothetical protein VE00_10542 [Pseudogymnoascus sp. WSF 3629]|nr:hypothetical protein VE00_10542 [Pseudogymnoascus sp. WSF 3629]
MSGHREGASKPGSLKGSFNLRSVKTGGKKAQNDDCIAVNVLLERWERRRTQNRLAQRKFRMSPIPTKYLHFIYPPNRRKAKESLSRDAENHLHAENQLHAGNSYTIPDSDDLGLESELSGLPWGGLSMRHIVKHSP